MTWTLTEDLDAFLGTAGPFLHARPAENTVFLTVTDTLRAAGLDMYGDLPPRFGWWRDGAGEVAAVWLRTPPWPVNVSRAPDEAVEALAALLAVEGDAAPTEVFLPRPEDEAFARAWQSHAGRRPTVRHETRLYRLAELSPPQAPPAGRSRTATAADRALLIDWTRGFLRDVGDDVPGDRAVVALVDDRLSHRGIEVWEEADGTPVAMAQLTRLVAGQARVANVYTPPAHRGRGYASVLTAAVSGRARQAGAREVVLFTDLANPTSNAIYQRIGYRPVLDRVTLAL
ncbi:GNAT family N-acetyltransferase [Streptomyces sp. NPDC127098]|uniref:GNAT family N-acetyltransferase n=1 Tax=Streptomyces sp. NPDC127098 TaxID=3347137 RepID=UPI00366439F8